MRSIPPVLRTQPERVMRFVGIQMAVDTTSLVQTARMLALHQLCANPAADPLSSLTRRDHAVQGARSGLDTPTHRRYPHGRHLELATGHLARIESPEALAALIRRC